MCAACGRVHIALVCALVWFAHKQVQNTNANTTIDCQIRKKVVWSCRVRADFAWGPCINFASNFRRILVCSHAVVACICSRLRWYVLCLKRKKYQREFALLSNPLFYHCENIPAQRRARRAARILSKLLHFFLPRFSRWFSRGTSICPWYRKNASLFALVIT